MGGVFGVKNFHYMPNDSVNLHEITRSLKKLLTSKEHTEYVSIRNHMNLVDANDDKDMRKILKERMIKIL